MTPIGCGDGGRAPAAPGRLGGCVRHPQPRRADLSGGRIAERRIAEWRIAEWRIVGGHMVGVRIAGGGRPCA
jgi:hypothetical protein